MGAPHGGGRGGEGGGGGGDAGTACGACVCAHGRGEADHVHCIRVRGGVKGCMHYAIIFTIPAIDFAIFKNLI